MERVCPVGHPPGVGTSYCRICGRDYLMVDTAPEQMSAAAVGDGDTMTQVLEAPTLLEAAAMAAVPEEPLMQPPVLDPPVMELPPMAASPMTASPIDGPPMDAPPMQAPMATPMEAPADVQVPPQLSRDEVDEQIEAMAAAEASAAADPDMEAATKRFGRRDLTLMGMCFGGGFLGGLVSGGVVAFLT